MDKVWIASYYSDHGETDTILGVYVTEQEALNRAREFKKAYAKKDDSIYVQCFIVGEKYVGCAEEMYNNSSSINDIINGMNYLNDPPTYVLS